MEKEFIINIVMPSAITSRLDKEMKLLRPSLMYADKVILNSSELNSIVEAYNEYGEDYKEGFIEQQYSIIESLKEGIEQNPGKTLSFKGVDIQGEDFVEAFIQDIKTQIALMDEKDKNFMEILPYILSGDIQLQDYDMIPEANDKGEIELNPDKQDELYVANLLQDAVGEKYYTLFEEQLFETVDAIVKKNVKVQSPQKYKHAGFVYQVIPTLPNFEKAGLDEIIDIRKELSKPLERFHRSVYNFSKEIETLPWEKGFEEECKEIYHAVMADAVDEIEDLSKTSSILKNIAHNFSQMDIIEVAGGITASVLAGEYWAIMASLLTVTKVSKEVIEYNNRIERAKKNYMYFYYEAGERLKKL